MADQNDIHLTAYMCKTPWTPSGLCSPRTYNQAVEAAENDDGDVEVIASMCPSGYDCRALEVTAYLLPEGRDPIDCLLCIPACGREMYQDVGNLEEFNLYLAAKINQVRATHPEECPPESCEALSLSDWLTGCASWMAKDMAYYNFFGHIDHGGRNPLQRLQAFYIPFSVQDELIARKEYISEEPGLKDIADEFFQQWMSDEDARAVLTSIDYQIAGFGYGKKTYLDPSLQLRTEYYGVADFIDSGSLDPEYGVSDPARACTGECAGKIGWRQDYYEIETGSGIERVPLPNLITEVEIPRICSLRKLEFIFELSSCRAIWEFPAEPGEILEGSGLKFTWEDMSPCVEGKWRHTWGLTNSSCFIPGEWMAVYAYLENYSSQCNPFLLAWGWFETQCWTSGRIQGCGILDEEGNPVEGGPGQEMEDEWEGDESLHWHVEFKGGYFWVKCSDFARYALGDRCFIYKNGLSRMTDAGNNMVQDPACRWPYSSSGQISGLGELLSDSNVSYRLDRERDIIVPQTMYGIGA